ncbi:MAG: DUF4870 domain-containing protein [Anaerolineales bacterium]
MTLVSSIQSKANFGNFIYFFACLFAPIIVLLGFALIQSLISVVASFFSFIKISPNGLEQKHLLDKHIRCTWSDVDRLGKYFLFYDVIYLNSYERIGSSFSLNSIFRFLRPKQGFIFLSGYEGWSDGELANELKRYIPKLFEDEQAYQGNHSENKDSLAPSITQESRLLVAFSHASILFSYIGVFVPIVIYATQKKKSTYIRFQALQALVWQIISIAFITLTTFCMMISITTTSFMASLSGSNNPGSPNVGIFLLAIALSLLLTIGNLAFVIYGIVGAIMTYQEKDFRYIIIANLIEKRKEFKTTSKD